MDTTLSPSDNTQSNSSQILQSTIDVIKPVEYKIKLIKNGETNINTLRVDNCDHYYEGKIDLTKFPKELNDPLSVVEKSLKNYNTPNIKITGTFTPQNVNNPKSAYVIKFICVQEFFTTEKEVIIDMIFHKKKEIDYINERFNEMNNEINTLKSDNTELRSQLNEMETKLLELQFNGDGNDSESSEEKVVVTKQTNNTTTTTTSAADKRRSRFANN
jgi:hypothetical protein